MNELSKKLIQKIKIPLIALGGIIGLVYLGPWIIIIAPILFTPVLIIAIVSLFVTWVSVMVNLVRRRQKGQKHLFSDTDIVRPLSDEGFRIEDRFIWDETLETYVKVEKE
jgi:hypothetical protein